MHGIVRVSDWTSHARSVVACGFDGQTGELFERRLCPDHGEIISWVRGLPVRSECATRGRTM